MDETVALDLNGAVIRSWPKGDQPEIWWLKWFDADHVVLNLHGPEVAIVSAENWQRHHLGYLSELYLSPNFMLATYGEEQFHGSRPGEFESNVISVFLRNGEFAETAWMQDFAPVENALNVAGFSISEIKLQLSSTGRIIVSDSNKAALLEFSGLAQRAAMRPKTHWIDLPASARLAIMARPRASDWLEDEIAGWRAEGMGVIMSLDREDGLCHDLAMEFISFPFPDRGVPLSTRETIASPRRCLRL